MFSRTMLAMMFGIATCAATATAQTTDAATAAGSRPSIHQRLQNQRERIQSGTGDDQLTRGERARLRGRDAGIRAQARVERRVNGGQLSTGERAQLNRELNRNSRRIYRDRHNNRTPMP